MLEITIKLMPGMINLAMSFFFSGKAKRNAAWDAEAF